MKIHHHGKKVTLSILATLILSSCATSEGLNTGNKILNADTLQAKETLSTAQLESGPMAPAQLVGEF